MGNKFFSNRFGSILVLWVVFMAVSFVTRLVFATLAWESLDASVWGIVKSFVVGTFFDIVAFGYFMLPFILFVLFMPLKTVQKHWYRWATYFLYSIAIFLIVFLGISEYFFWEEFEVRFNFIAVDYLIYTTEVVNNILESYPMVWLFVGVGIVTLAIMFTVYKLGWIDSALKSRQRFPSRAKGFALLMIVPVFSLLFVTHRWAAINDNVYNSELAKSGLYSFVEAYKNNELDYKVFYPTIDEKEAFTDLRRLLSSPDKQFLSDDVMNPVYRVENAPLDKKYNLMLVTVESLSGAYLEFKGSQKGKITPFLDSLAKQSLMFTNLYATGTRTVRGLEAINLSVPPTPGTSIVRRPNNDNLYSLGHIFKQQGYQNKFIYGGNGFFDNMNAFFAGNGFDIVDKGKLSKEEITFSNAWGTCDEDLYRRALKEADSSFAKGAPFVNYILTTSNHRPYTFPEVGIELPNNREGGVRYTDYALERFFTEAKAKPWFKNTVFVIVADHCAGSAGKTQLPIQNYQIPCIIYCPALLEPQEIAVMCSQVDVLPTLLAIMGVSYESTFFGFNALHMKPEDGRAFIATYQELGYMKGDQLLQLAPKRKPKQFAFDADTGQMDEVEVNDSLKRDAISLYQTAETIFVRGKSKVGGMGSK